MPVKKAVAKKAPVKKTLAKRSSAKKVARGDVYACGVCGLVVSVDQACTCVDELCDIVCCGLPMKPKATRAR